MTVFRIEVRRSPAALAFPVLIGLGSLAGWGELSLWVDAWFFSSTAITATVVFLGPVIAAVAAWAAARDTRRKTQDLLRMSSQGEMSAHLMNLAAVMAWALFAYGTVAISLTVQALIKGAWGSPEIVWALAGAASIVLHVVVGFIIGGAIPRILTPPLVAVGFYVLETIASAAASPHAWWSYLAPATVVTEGPFNPVSSTFFAVQALWFLAIAAVVISLWCRRYSAGQWRNRSVGLLAVSLGLAVVSGLLISGMKQPYGREEKISYLCDGNAPVICVHPAYWRALVPLRSGLAPLLSKLAGTPFQVERLEQQPFGRDATPGSIPVYLNELYATSYVGMARDELVRRMFTGRCLDVLSDADDVERVMPYLNLIEAWLVGSLNAAEMVELEEKAAQEKFTSMGDGQRRLWLTRHADKVRSCSITSSDF